MFKYISVGKKYLESSQVASCWNFLQRNQVRLCNPWESSYHSPGRTLKVLGWSQTQPRSCGYRDTDLVCEAIMSHLLLESLPDLWISIQSQTWRQNLRLKNAIPKSSIFFFCRKPAEFPLSWTRPVSFDHLRKRHQIPQPKPCRAPEGKLFPCPPFWNHREQVTRATISRNFIDSDTLRESNMAGKSPN